MGYQFRMAPEIEQWAARLTAPLHSAWRGKPGREARRVLGQIGFWIAQPGLDAAYQRQLVAFQLSRRDVADAAHACKQLELQIAAVEQQAAKLADPVRKAPDADQDDLGEQLAELRRQHADLQAGEERVTAVSQRLMAELNALRDGQEAIKAAYSAAEEAAKTVWHR